MKPHPDRLGSTEQQLKADTAFGFLDRRQAAPHVFNPTLISNEPPNTMLSAILAEMRRSRSLTFSVAFITPGAVALLKQAFLDYQGSATIITSTYLGFNAPAAFKELLNLPTVETRIVPGHIDFHPKGYVF